MHFQHIVLVAFLTALAVTGLAVPASHVVPSPDTPGFELDSDSKVPGPDSLGIGSWAPWD